MGPIYFQHPFIALLVKVDGPYAILDFLKIRSDINDVIHTTHVPEQPEKAPLPEFYELLCNPYLIELWGLKVVLDEDVSRNSGNVLLNQGVPIDQIIDPVRRKDVLQLQPVNPVSIRNLDVIIIRIAIKLIRNPDPERPGIAKLPKINPLHAQVFRQREVAPDLQDRIDLRKLRPKVFHYLLRIGDGKPERFFSVRILVGHGL